MPRVAVIGYASVDHAMETDPFLAATGTTLVRRRLSHPWPHLGGITYAAEGLTNAGHDVRAVTWVGQDTFGAAYTERLAAWGVDVSGVDQSGDRTPSNFLFYAPDEQLVTVYDPGEPVPDSLTETQRAVIADSDWVCLLVGPRPVTVEILDLLRPEQHLAWTVKDDPDAYPGGLVHRLLSRASVLTFSTRERLFLERAVAPAHYATAPGPSPCARKHKDPRAPSSGTTAPRARWGRRRSRRWTRRARGMCSSRRRWRA